VDHDAWPAPAAECAQGDLDLTFAHRTYLQSAAALSCWSRIGPAAENGCIQVPRGESRAADRVDATPFGMEASRCDPVLDRLRAQAQVE